MEDYIFSTCRGEAVFLYVNNPCVVIGSNQAINSEANYNFCKQNHIDILRRISGGGAVYHDHGNLNYCFFKDRSAGKFPLGSDFLKPIVDILNAKGIPVVTGSRKDLWLDDKKVSGTASHISNKRAMHHGTLLYDCNLDNLRHSLAAMSPDCLTEVNKGTFVFTKMDMHSYKSNQGAISSVPSKVINIKEFMENKGLIPAESRVFFNELTNDFLSYYKIDKLSQFEVSEIDQIVEIQNNIYKKVNWTYKK